ncbi:MAG: hypothetical protein M1820_004298 [Bogoriella megaspora]|nr:MAG: hypothetical protein M1820_004298 [Bogoriella megaspora]
MPPPNSLPKLLSTLKSTQLKILALLTGIPTGGTKPHLISQLSTSLPTPLILSTPFKPSRILSVDLGLRNLGLCVADITFPPSTMSPKSKSNPPKPKMQVKHWSLKTLLPPSLEPLIFHPSNLAPLAVSLVRNTLLPHSPSIILVERQRHRSGSGAAVQEWTVRVNALESMVWAVLATLRSERSTGGKREEDRFPRVEGVEPSRVARFWLDGGGKAGVGGMEGLEGLGMAEEGEEAGRKARRKAKDVKKEKIGLVRGWLESAETAPFELGFEKEVDGVRDVVLGGKERKSAKSRKGRSRREEDGGETGGEVKSEVGEEVKVGKLDDLADCLLQAATWVQWEHNRREIMRRLDLSLEAEKPKR